MHSDMIGKIEKARQYASEPERVDILALRATFHGSNSSHSLRLHEGIWSHDDTPEQQAHVSPHVMALQRILEKMLSPEARQLEDATGLPMHSDMIGKIEKARQYATEPERVELHELTARFNGSNGSHIVSLHADHSWQCDCSFFASWGTCQHVMALQKMLTPMISFEAQHAAVASIAQDETVLV